MRCNCCHTCSPDVTGLVRGSREGVNSMSVEENKVSALATVDAMNRKDTAFIDEHPGLTESRPSYQQVFAAFPDIHGPLQRFVRQGAMCDVRSLVACGT